MPRYMLMNKNRAVLEFEYDLDAHQVTRVHDILCLEAAPFGIADEKGQVSKKDLNYWWYHRAIPASREQISRLLDNLRLESTLELAERNFGLSLSDCYWINDCANPQQWADINFFDNEFSDDLGILTLGQDSSPSIEVNYASVNLTSPNSTLGGDLRKKWKIINGTRMLLKAGAGFVNQEPYNEVVATALHKRLLQAGEYVPYTLFEEDRRVYSACPNLLAPNQELIPAWDLIRKRKQKSSESDLMFYVRCCVEFGLDERAVMDGLAKMFVCDYIIANRDRHWRNFGVVRNVETLEAVGLAPIFDTGSCLFSDAVELELPIDFKYRAKPFKYDGMPPREQVLLFEGHFEWFDAQALEGFVEELAEILGSNPNIMEARIEKIAERVRTNIESMAAISRRGLGL